MTKKNIRPQQVAPVERETISTAKDQSGQVTTATNKAGHGGKDEVRWGGFAIGYPFAGDDAE